MPRFDRSTFPSQANTPELMAEWLGKWSFDRFVTLTFSRPGDGVAAAADKTMMHMRERLRQWDARMNRRLIGGTWSSRPDNRMFNFFAAEKIDTNPHWHGLVNFYHADEDETVRQGSIFDKNAEAIWLKLVPAGTVDVKTVNDNPGVIDYVAKSLCNSLSYNHYIVPDEFLNT